MSEVLFGGGWIVTRNAVVRGTLVVRDGAIADIDGAAARRAVQVDIDGDYLIPGLVELHTDVLEQHANPRPGVRWPVTAAVAAYDAALVAAGITTAFDSLPVGYGDTLARRDPDPRPLAEAVREAQHAGLLRAEHYLHLRCEVSGARALELFEVFAGDPLVRLVSLMDHTPGQRQFVSLDKYREYNQGKYGLSDAQMDQLIARRQEDHGRYAERHRRAIAGLARKHGVPLVSHDDATAAHVEAAVDEGVAIAEFPTTLEAARAARGHGLAILAGAPNLVCGRSHSGNIAAADLAAAGLLDILSSDYVLSSALHGAFALHRRHGAPLPRAIAAVTRTPAAAAGLEDRGELAAGRRADLVRVRLVGDVPVIRGVWRAGERVA
jgi:alpha-D-ribose 1-methylphosphonate 5-triphosphate diphosphatase